MKTRNVEAKRFFQKLLEIISNSFKNTHLNIL